MSAGAETVHFLDLASALADLRATAAPVAGRRQRVLWRESGRVVVLFALDPGATLPDHAAPGTVTIHGVDGAVEVAAAGAVHRLRAQQLVALSPGVRHSVTAIGAEPAAFLVQIAAAG
jgi:quercetin dioxygenase-like cupin family protein